MTRIKSIIIKVAVALVAVYVLWLGFKWTQMRVFVGADEALVLTSKFGPSLPQEYVVAPTGTNYKGVQQDVLGPGRYFYDPFEYEWQVISQVEVPAGDPDRWEWDEEGNLKNAEQVGPKLALLSLKQSLKSGSPPQLDSEVVPDGYKGVQESVLSPGTYKLNPALMTWTIVPAIVVPPGSVGVVTRLVGEIGQVSSASLTKVSDTSTSQPTTRLVVGRTER